MTTLTQLVLVPATTTPAILTIGSDTWTSTALTISNIVTSVDRATFAATMYGPPASATVSTVKATMTGQGTGTISERGVALTATVVDSASVVNKTITGAANNGAGLIRITAASHTLTTGDRVAVYGVVGTTEANGAWTVTVITANTFDLQASTFSSAYVSGGTVTNRPMLTCVRAIVTPSLARGGLTGTAAAADDLNCFTAENNGTATATDAYYVAAGAGISGGAWGVSFNTDSGHSLSAFRASGASPIGLDLSLGTFSAAAIVLPNNSTVSALNAAANAYLPVFRVNNINEVEIGTKMLWNAAVNVRLDTTTGSKIGTATNEKLGFFNATPVIQQASTGTATGFVAGGGTTVTDSSTFTGAVGSTAYRISDIVKALKNLGLMAS